MLAATSATVQPFLAMHIDTYFANYLGIKAVVALGITITSITTWTWIVTGPIWALGVQVGRTAGSISKIRQQIFYSLAIVIAVSTILGTILLLFTDMALNWAGGSSEDIVVARSYHKIMAGCLPIIATYQLSVRLLLALNRYNEVFVAAVFTLLINISLNLLLLLVWQAGLVGLALSVVISQAIGTVFLLAVAVVKGSNAAEKVDHGEQEEKKLPLRVLCATLSTLSMAVVYYFLSRTCNSLGTAQAAIHAKVYTLFLTTVYITGGLMTVTETKGYAFKFAHPDFSLYRRQNINRAIVIGSVMAIAYIIPSLLIWNYSIQAMHTNLFPVLLISLLLQPPTTLLWALLALLRSQGMFGRLLVIEIASMIIFVVAINIVPYTDLAWIVWLIFAGYFIIRIVLAWLLNFIGTVNTT